MIVFKCPECEAETKLSLLEDRWKGPRRCWKCHKLFFIRTEGEEVTSCEPMSDEEYNTWQEAEEIRKKLQNK
jgi:hypothetical protein